MLLSFASLSAAEKPCRRPHWPLVAYLHSPSPAFMLPGSTWLDGKPSLLGNPTKKKGPWRVLMAESRRRKLRNHTKVPASSTSSTSIWAASCPCHARVAAIAAIAAARGICPTACATTRVTTRVTARATAWATTRASARAAARVTGWSQTARATSRSRLRSIVWSTFTLWWATIWCIWGAGAIRRTRTAAGPAKACLWADLLQKAFAWPGARTTRLAAEEGEASERSSLGPKKTPRLLQFYKKS